MSGIHLVRAAALLLGALTLLVGAGRAPAAAQPGTGVIRIAAAPVLLDPNELNPAICNTGFCSDVLPALLNPPLLGVAPGSGGAWAPADVTRPDDVALTTRVSVLAYPDGNTALELALRDDLTWSDGAPVTVYDVLLMLRWHGGNTLLAAWPLGDHTLAVIIRTQAVAPALAELGEVRAWPSHVLAPPGYADAARAAFADVTVEDAPAAFQAWRESRRTSSDQQAIRTPGPLPTAGRMSIVDFRPRQQLRLRATTGDGAIVLVASDDPVAAFTRGEVDALLGVPLALHTSLSAMPGVTALRAPERHVLTLVFNLADPQNPQPAFDADGAPIPQGNHPLLGDVRVRRALVAAVDVPTLITAAYLGEAVRATTPFPPGSWPGDALADLVAPVAYDPDAADTLLSAAGWVRVGRSIVRTCRGCTTAPEGTPLQVGLAATDHDASISAVTRLITAQWERVGVLAIPSGYAGGQRFDVALQHIPILSLPAPVSAVYAPLLRTEDVPEARRNISSYSAYDPFAPTTSTDNDLPSQLLPLADALNNDVPLAPLLTPYTLFVVRGLATPVTIDPYDPYATLPTWRIVAR